jgi:Tfp pilus assembly PilM family ATPase
MNYIALEYDDKRILVVSAQLVSKRVRFQHAFSIVIDQTDLVQASEKLKQALADHRIGKADALVIVKRSGVEIRELNLPPAPDNDLPDMVRFMARNEFASLTDQWLLDFVPLSSDESAPRKVLASGLSPERQKQILKVAEGAGLRIKHILLRPFESFSLLQSRLAEGKRSLIVDLGDFQIDMIVSVNRNIVSTRTVRLAEGDADSRINQILAEVKRTAVSSENVLGNRPLDEIILLGDTPIDAPLAAGIRDRMQVEVRVEKPFDLVEQDFSQTPAGDSAQYSALLGSLLQQAAGTRHAIDYLNPRRPIVKTDLRKKLLIYGGLAASILCLATAIGWWVLRTQGMEIAALEQQVEQLVEKNLGDDKQPGVEQIMGEVRAIDKWKLSSIDWLEELHEKSQRFLTPDDAIVDILDASIRDRGPMINIKGRVASDTREKLFDALTSRPYQIKPEQWEAEDQDPSYPEPYDFRISFGINEDEMIKKLDQQADAHFNQQREQRIKPK